MDARITKPRLSNLLSYDWLKILVAVAVAIAALCVFFTTVRTRPANEQTFTVYAYSDLSPGTDSTSLQEDLLRKKVFSYEILDTQVENLTNSTGSIFSGLYSGATYTTRLVNDARTVMFVYGVDDTESESYDAVASLVGVNGAEAGSARHGFLDFEEYLNDCERYLIRFFGENWRTGTLDTAKADECFAARNGKDKRYRTEAKKAAGALEERDRLEKLREDYTVVSDRFADGTLTFATVTVDEERAAEYEIAAGTFNCGVSLGKLNKISRLYYHSTETESETTTSAAGLSMILFNSSALGDRSNDLRYETVSFLRYLVGEYGA